MLNRLLGGVPMMLLKITNLGMQYQGNSKSENRRFIVGIKSLKQKVKQRFQNQNEVLMSLNMQHCQKKSVIN